MNKTKIGLLRQSFFYIKNASYFRTAQSLKKNFTNEAKKLFSHENSFYFTLQYSICRFPYRVYFQNRGLILRFHNCLNLHLQRVYPYR